jgi:hypothetical protein
MNLDFHTALALATTLFAALSLRWSRRADRRAHEAQGLSVRAAAAADLADALHRLRPLTRHADVAPVNAGQVAKAMQDFEDLAERHRFTLPPHLAAIQREVRAAMGNCFGAPGWAGLGMRLADQQLATFDPHWWDITHSYLNHVNFCLQDWRTAPTRRKPSKLTYFHAWRADEDVAYFGYTRNFE